MLQVVVKNTRDYMYGHGDSAGAHVNHSRPVAWYGWEEYGGGVSNMGMNFERGRCVEQNGWSTYMYGNYIKHTDKRYARRSVEVG